jgi:hypothetical protein
MLACHKWHKVNNYSLSLSLNAKNWSLPQAFLPQAFLPLVGLLGSVIQRGLPVHV